MDASDATADDTFVQTPAPAEHAAEPGKHKKKSKKKKCRADAGEAVVVVSRKIETLVSILRPK